MVEKIWCKRGQITSLTAYRWAALCFIASIDIRTLVYNSLYSAQSRACALHYAHFARSRMHCARVPRTSASVSCCRGWGDNFLIDE